MAVVILLAVGVVSLLVAGYWSALEHEKKREKALYKLQALRRTVQMYSEDNDGEFPAGQTSAEVFRTLAEGGYFHWVSNFKTSLLPCVGEMAYADPSDAAAKLREEDCSFGWVAGLSARSPSDFILIFDKDIYEAGPGFLARMVYRNPGRWVFFVGDYGVFMNEEIFQERLAEQRDKMREMEEGVEFVDAEE